MWMSAARSVGDVASSSDAGTPLQPNAAAKTEIDHGFTIAVDHNEDRSGPSMSVDAHDLADHRTERDRQSVQVTGAE
jgi:hypothetical protein